MQKKCTFCRTPPITADRLAEIHLGMAGRMGQRHEGLPRPRARRSGRNPSPPCSRRHSRARRAAARRSAWPCAAASPAPLRSASRIASITGSSGPSFGFSAGFVRAIARRHREPAHLGNRLPAQPEHPRRLTPAVALDEHKPPNRRVDLHREHPRPSLFESPRKDQPLPLAGFYSATQRPYAAAPVADYCSAAYRFGRGANFVSCGHALAPSFASRERSRPNDRSSHSRNGDNVGASRRRP